MLDLLVLGGGVMGLFTAYHASATTGRVAVLERGTVGDPTTASYGRTRSYRRDYLDATYARFADEAIRLWDEFEAATGRHVLVRCGCMNIASGSVTPELDQTYAQLSTDVLVRLGMPPEVLNRDEAERRYPYLRRRPRAPRPGRRAGRPRRRHRHAEPGAARAQGAGARARRHHRAAPGR